jgi:predicted nucleotidyltransferase component of viral defense system
MLITRQQLQVLNRRTLKYPLAVAEKDYFLTLALKLIAESPLGQTLVFKGGTALHHCYLPQHRFSEDLDFTSFDHHLEADAVTAVLTAGDFFAVRKLFTSPATIKIERLWYAGLLAQPGAIKVEIDRLQNVVLPPVAATYTNVWNLPVTVMAMDIREVCAEKIRAAGTRARYRDFYDLFLIFDSFQPDLGEIIGLLRQKEVRAPITSEGIARNWQRARQESLNELRAIHCTRQVEEQKIQSLVDSLRFDPVMP